jgi:hypothetical protein
VRFRSENDSAIEETESVNRKWRLLRLFAVKREKERERCCCESFLGSNAKQREKMKMKMKKMQSLFVCRIIKD